MPRIIISLILTLVLAGCMIGPNYRRPTVNAPERWRFEEKEAKDLANTPWWKQFGDPVLNELVLTALKENYDVKIAAARVEEFVGRYAVIRSALFPQVGIVGIDLRKEASRTVNPPFSTAAYNPYSDYLAVMSGSWQLDIWGSIRRATQAGRADLLASQEFRAGVILTVVTAVATAYTDLRDLDKQLEIARRTVSLREDSYRIFKLRFGRGIISELELKQAESEYQSALATIPLIQKLIAQTEDALSVLLGHNPGPIPRGKSLDELPLPVVPAGLPSELLARRPDIRQAEQNLIAANARIGVAKALYFPTISLTGQYGVESDDLVKLFGPLSRMWTYSVPITMPVFTGGAIGGQVKIAESVQQQALGRYQQVIQTAFKEVEDGLIDQAKTREQLDIQARQVEALRSYAYLARLRYENGYTSYIEVLDAERSLFSAELTYTLTKGLLFRALVNLYKSMGGGWVTEADKLTKG